MISFLPGRRGKPSIIDCLLTVLSRRSATGSWPERTFPQLTKEVTALRFSEMPQTSIRSTVYRADLFERAQEGAGTVRWKLNSKGRKLVANAAWVSKP
jgi:hypothetical protein